jgi:hypothetical protein
MAAPVTHLTHISTSTGLDVLTSSYTVAREHDLAENLPAWISGAKFWRGFLHSIRIHCHGAGTPQAVYFKLTADAAGDELIISETEAPFTTAEGGIATATRKTAIYSIPGGVLLDNWAPDTTDSKVYLWVRVDTGTANLQQTTIRWAE